MGLAASQAHLDLLTLRKSDLEYLVMQISDRGLQLTRDMESLAAEKARKLSNRILYVKTTDSNGEELTLSLNEENLKKVNLMVLNMADNQVIDLSKEKNDQGEPVTSWNIENNLRNGKWRLARLDEDYSASDAGYGYNSDNGYNSDIANNTKGTITTQTINDQVAVNSVSVDAWGSGKNDCLDRIIMNNYPDIEPYSSEFMKKRQELMNANPNIYYNPNRNAARANGVTTVPITDSNRHNAILYTGETFKLVGATKGGVRTIEIDNGPVYHDDGSYTTGDGVRHYQDKSYTTTDGIRHYADGSYETNGVRYYSDGSYAKDGIKIAADGSYTKDGKKYYVKEAIKNYDWRTGPDISDEYYTDDDEAAIAKYDAETAKIKSKDQEFDMQQKTAETQQKAVTNEIDGAQKLIEKTIEMSFKLFA